MRKMKDSGIEWIGEISEETQLYKLKYLCDIINGYTFKSELYCDSGINVIRITNVDDGKINNSNPRYYPIEMKDEIERAMLREKDILISLTGNVGRVGIIKKELLPAGLNQRVACIRPKCKLINNKFLFYFLNTKQFENECIENADGTAQLNLSTEWLKNQYIILPNQDVQKQIAIYLDNKVKEIDNIISKAKETIEEYKKYKQAVITEAVTKGLNPNVEMKDSGIEWIGEIPEEWVIVKLKNIAKIQTGNTPSKNTDENYYSSKGIMWVKPDNLNNLKPIQRTKEYLNDSGKKLARVVPPKTPLVCCIGSIGKVGYSDKEVAFNQQINSVEFNNKCNWKFGLYSLIANEYQHWLYSNGNVLKILNNECHGRITLSLPTTLEEQKEIVKFLDIKCTKIDNLITKKQELITQLEQYKKSLIYEYVTGKKEVSPSYAD